MSITDLLVVGVVAVFVGFIVWANFHHRMRMPHGRTEPSVGPPDGWRKREARAEARP